MEVSCVRREGKRVNAVHLGNGLLRPITDVSDSRVAELRKSQLSDTLARAVAQGKLSFNKELFNPTPEPPRPITVMCWGGGRTLIGGCQRHRPEPYEISFLISGWCGRDRNWKRHRATQYK